MNVFLLMLLLVFIFKIILFLFFENKQKLTLNGGIILRLRYYSRITILEYLTLKKKL